MAKKIVDMSMLSGVGSSARLIEKEATPAAATKSKLLTGLPVAFEERHKALYGFIRQSPEIPRYHAQRQSERHGTECGAECKGHGRPGPVNDP